MGADRSFQAHHDSALVAVLRAVLRAAFAGAAKQVKVEIDLLRAS